MEDIFAQENYEDLYEDAPCGYLSFLIDGTIVKINKTLLNWIGAKKEDVVSKKRFQDLIPLGERIFFESQFAPLLHLQNSIEEIHFNLVGSNKKRIPVLTSTKDTVSKDGTLRISRMTLFNIEDRKRFENELVAQKVAAEAALKAKADFLSMLSHEIRTPLNAIVGAANLLNDSNLSAEQREFTEMLTNSSSNLIGLINNILDFSKIESGAVILEKKEFRPKHFAEEIIRNFQGLAKTNGILVESKIEKAIPSLVIGDKLKIGQILTNLIGNAIKFTKKGSVTLTVKLVELLPSYCSLMFEVADTGIGISPDQSKHIFEEYKQAEYDTGVNYGGSGLGLAISSKLAKLYGTKITLESELGVGSKFSFVIRFDTAREAQNVDEDMQSILDNQSLRGLRILVADDSEDNQFIVRHYFKRWGVSSESATNGVEAVQMVKDNHFDMVLMDMQMPGMDGREAAFAIRGLEDAEKSKTPILAFSASSQIGGKDILKTVPVNEVISKPFKPEDLISKITFCCALGKK